MRAWRICPARRAATAFDGEGARLYGGRWNHAGLPAVYLSATASLGILEYLVHADADVAPEPLVRIPADWPDDIKVDEIKHTDLPRGWRSYPASDSTKDLGSAWLRAGRAPVLSVPSVIVPRERNFVLNPRHPLFRKIRTGRPEAFTLDPRLWPVLTGRTKTR